MSAPGRQFKAFISLIAVLLFAAAAEATVYSLNRTIGSGSVTGSITTDGTLGALDEGDLADWTLTLDDGSSTFTLRGPASGNNSVVYIDSGYPALSATSTSLSFDFSREFACIIFQNPFLGSNQNFYGLAGTSSGCIDNFLSGGEGMGIDPGTHQRVSFAGTQVIGTAVAEPTTVALLGLGLAGLGFSRRKP